ncbi:MAG TPA: hypothetical protein VK963_03735 [Candidatus Saccharimonadales bacterium]|nr:hypothetical protein [Candidatus Saccharimonadales bacterium]
MRRTIFSFQFSIFNRVLLRLSAHGAGSERGLVSLLTTVIISILLLIIVTGMVGLMIGEQRQAIDADQSTRAYYAAEAGVEDALLKIKRDLNNGGPITFPAGCQNSGVDLGSANLVYTCQRVTTTTNNLSGRRGIEEPIQLDLAGAPNFNRIQLDWNLADQDSTNFATPGGFPQGRPWPHPAVMELTVVSYPNGNFSAAAIELDTLVIKPTTGAAATKNYRSPGALVTTGCSTAVTPADPYNCRISIVGFDSSRQYVLRLRPRYNGASYRLRVLQGGSLVTVPDQSATIDVTARAGDVFRRVVTKVPIRSGVAGGLDYVLFSDTDICKDFSVSLNQVSPGSCSP